jgi:hypothetical protein
MSGMYKVVQIWPGPFVCKQVTVCPGHIWTTLYNHVRACVVKKVDVWNVVMCWLCASRLILQLHELLSLCFYDCSTWEEDHLWCAIKYYPMIAISFGTPPPSYIHQNRNQCQVWHTGWPGLWISMTLPTSSIPLTQILPALSTKVMCCSCIFNLTWFSKICDSFFNRMPILVCCSIVLTIKWAKQLSTDRTTPHIHQRVMVEAACSRMVWILRAPYITLW